MQGPRSSAAPRFFQGIAPPPTSRRRHTRDGVRLRDTASEAAAGFDAMSPLAPVKSASQMEMSVDGSHIRVGALRRARYGGVEAFPLADMAYPGKKVAKWQEARCRLNS